MNVLRHWSDEKVAAVAERLGTPTTQRRDDVRRVLYEADAVPLDLHRGAVGIIETARQELRDAIKGGNPQVLREYAEDAVEAMSAFLDHPRGQ